MTKEQVYAKYKKGYVGVSLAEWAQIALAFNSKMLSPGGVADKFNITRSAVGAAARNGRIYYFVVSKPWRERGYVLIPEEGLDEVFNRSEEFKRRAS